MSSVSKPFVLDKCISVKDAAEYSGYCQQYLRRLLRQGKLTSVKVGPLWLIEMESFEWHLSEVGIPTVYDFESGEPANFVYRLDYRSHFKMDKEDYLQLFRDAGWAYVGEMSAWHYFRKGAQPGEDLEIYTDAESKISKYQRLLAFLAILMLPLSMAMITMRGRFLQFIIFPLFSLYVYALIRILIRINQLKRI